MKIFGSIQNIAGLKLNGCCSNSKIPGLFKPIHKFFRIEVEANQKNFHQLESKFELVQSPRQITNDFQSCLAQVFSRYKSF